MPYSNVHIRFFGLIVAVVTVHKYMYSLFTGLESGEPMPSFCVLYVYFRVLR